MHALAQRSWTDEVEMSKTIRWTQWAEQTIAVLKSNDVLEGLKAERMLREIASYLDDQYQGGYDGIALTPRERFVLSFDH